jgi:hypothetical protein
MREAFLKHFDVVVVVWVLALAVGWSLVAISRSPLPADQWSGAPQAESGWALSDGSNW